MHYKILVADDDPLSLISVKKFLEMNGYVADIASTPSEARDKLRLGAGTYALVILDYKFGDEFGSDVATSLLAINPRMYILMYSGDTSRDAVKSSWKAGAVGFVEKAADPEELLNSVRAWCHKFEETYLPVTLENSTSDQTHLISSIGLVGRSKALAVIAEKVKRYAEHQETVLLIGETGTGKEKIARALHPGDPAKFIAVNCASYSGNSELMESDLFGYTKGAFTGAAKDHMGVFEAADGGTVLLDEIHTLELRAQQKLLRVLQEKAVRPLGTSREYKVNFRLIAAAKTDLLTMLEEKKFIADLYERLNVLPITIPPLRERIEDVEPLVAFFCEQFQRETGSKKRFLARTVRYLERYRWPRNVRELENLVKRLCIDVSEEEIQPEHLDARFFGSSQIAEAPIREQLDSLFVKHADKILKSGVSQREAARRLGVPESSLRRMLKQRRVGISAH